MNANVAKKLNELLYLSAPMELNCFGNCIQVTRSTGGCDTALMRGIRAAINDRTEDARAVLISDAARHKRKAPTISKAVFDYDGGGSVSYTYDSDTDHQLGRAAKELALPVIAALIDAHNARTLADYEAYRVLCEQKAAAPIAD